MKPIVGIIMGSDSDLPVMKEAAEILAQFEVPYEMTIVSAHRTPDKLYSYSKEAKDRGIKVIIAGAGGAAHLPGMVAAMTALPVVGVPVKTSTLNGVDSLYSVVQMPPGVPVATVAINGAKNAGILAAQILGTVDEKVYNAVDKYKKDLESMVLKKAEDLESTIK
ncbi:5-(carboxyamino)imidazole ribonucleotide mutase [Clostridium intestinale]|uniref:N5-carboxyaminoimidazole ribonucleotide mutase n=1 Tax=Clostridium intestinale DSM 6191 TaxID=1121320 RepID=A0A1M5YN41_9CLOT|nr:5-(carboxyamino)imidazole ribonucleotide mutase [Clostridium intestinale]SHI13406.1 5-(carboxyamino)imidazole ribonucleotide mutase [Clostridium intestinale DSM 6191]